MTTRTVKIASTVGLHARPANLFVKEVSAHGIPVLIGRPGGKPVNAASMLGIMSLGLKCGEEAELSSTAEGADEVLEALVSFLEIDHDSHV